MPEALEQAIYKALARNAADRFPTARDFAHALADAAASPHATVPATVTRAARRRMPKVSAVAALLALAVAAGLAWLTFGRSSVSAPPSASRLAVLPFSVPAAGPFGYLVEGMVDLLSRNLNGVGEQVTVDPGRVMSTLGGEEKRGVQDAERGHEIARRLGAGRYILGSVHAAGGHLRIQAQLYEESTGAPEPIAQASAEGDSTALFEHGGPPLRPAAGERRAGARAPAWRRPPRSRRARSPRSRPISTRSGISGPRSSTRRWRGSSARRRSTAASPWRTTGSRSRRRGPDGRVSWHRPCRARLALADRLGERDRALLSAFAEMGRGAPDAAERRYREILEKYPDDLEARFQLANVLYSYNAPRGRPPGEAREHYDRVLEVDPKFICPI